MGNFRKLATLLLPTLLMAAPLAPAQRPTAQGTEGRPPAGGNPSAEASRHEAATQDPSYVIGPADIIDVSVWREPDVSRMVPVRPDGKISLPLLHDVQAAGFTPLELAAMITEQLKKFVTQPQVTVIVTAINSQRIYLIGEVNRAGAIPLLPKMTVLQALSMAGGFSQFADPRKITVMRNEGGKTLTYPFNYKEAMKGKRLDQNILLKPGDMIVVP